MWKPAQPQDIELEVEEEKKAVGNNAEGENTQKTAKSATSKEYQADEHSLELHEIAKRYQTELNYDNLRKSKGLTTEEATRRLERDGPNRLTPPKKTPEIIKFLKFFIGGFMILLEAAAILCFVAYAVNPDDAINLYLAIILIVIIIGTCVMSYLQERKSTKLMEGFTTLLPQSCKVLRGGLEMKIPADQLVVGDIIGVIGGDKVPADIRIIECDNFKVDNSSLTGESEPQNRNAKVSKEPLPMEAKNLAFYGTLALDGSAYGIVIRTGDNTLIGQIASLTSGEKKMTALEIEVHRFVKFISIGAVVMGIIFFAIDIAIDPKSYINVLINTIGVIVANVPEGLPATVTITLTLAARKLAEKYVWVKKLESVETLGSITMIASDKTGTLTQNKMTAVHAWYDGKIYETRADSIKREETSELLQKDSPTCSALLRIAAICSRAEFQHVDGQEALNFETRPIIGDASETALLRLCESYLDTMTMREEYPKVFEIPFNSTNKFQVSIHIKPQNQQTERIIEEKSIERRKTLIREQEELNRTLSKQQIQRNQSSLLRLFGNQNPSQAPLRYRSPTVAQLKENEIQKTKSTLDIFNKQKERLMTNASSHKSTRSRLLVIKGAPEVILGKCTHYIKNGQPEPITEAWKQTFQSTVLELASRGERILGFAHLPFEDDTDPKTYSPDLNNFPSGGYHFAGLFALIDPPRPGVPNAVKSAHTAGINVVMVTGDHPLTAKAIAKQIGILTKPTADDLAKERGVPVSDIKDEEVKAVVVNGQMLREFTEEDWQRTIRKPEIVFARTSPQQKLEIVQHFQAIDHIVAVTGDGVNDSPALKAADIGVAMGIAGSDVAKEAADIILMNDDFSSIIDGIQGGRVIFDNLQKSIEYTLSHLVPEIGPFLLSVLVGFPLGLSTLLLLCIDLGTELAPAISLAYEHPESNIMERPPRNTKKERLVTTKSLAYSYLQIGMIEFAACFATYATVFEYHDIPLRDLPLQVNHDHFVIGAKPLIIKGRILDEDEQLKILRQAQTAWFYALVICQMGNLIACKTKRVSVFRHGFRNMHANAALIIVTVILVVLIFVPGITTVFGTEAPEHWQIYLIPLPFAVFIVVYRELVKWWTRLYPFGLVARYL